jgi:hypothetical protein
VDKIKCLRDCDFEIAEICYVLSRNALIRFSSQLTAPICRPSKGEARIHSKMRIAALALLLAAPCIEGFAPYAAPSLGLRSRATARIAPQNLGPRMLLGGEQAQQSTLKALPPAGGLARTAPLKMASTSGEKKGGIDFQLITYFFLWYLGNYYCETRPNFARVMGKLLRSRENRCVLPGYVEETARQSCPCLRFEGILFFVARSVLL